MLSINTDDIRDIQAAYQAYDREAIWMAAGFKLPLLWEWYLQNDFPEDSKLLARWEYEIALLDFKGKVVFGYVYSANNPAGRTGAFPDAENVPQETWEYIRGRAESTSNAFLKARYSHLLWSAPKGVKTIRWGEMAIDSYLAAIEYLRQNHGEQPDFNAGLLIGRLFETLAALNRTATHGRSAVQALAHELLFNTSWDFHSKNSIASTMIEQPKVFGKDAFSGVLAIYEAELCRKRSPGEDDMFASHQLPVAIKIAEYIGSDVSKWHSETGACYLRIIESGTIKADWISLEMCRRALAAYAEVKDKGAVEKVEALYASFKPTARLVNIEIPFTPKANKLAIKLAKSSKRYGMLLLKLPEDKIYHALSSGFLFPKLSTFPASVRKEKDEYTKLFYSVRFDGQKNIITKNNEEKRHLYSLYSHHAQLILNPYLYEVFSEGIKKRILTLDGFLYYLKNNTWIGKADPTIDLGGEISSIDWVKLLQPAITQFFVQVHMFGNSQYFNPDFVLCIDSLSLKFEGLLRAFCERVALPTSELKKKGMQEKFINKILDHELMKKYFTPDDLMFFNYVFTEHGLDLRNNVAHSFYQSSDYTFDDAILLIAALLRIGKYDQRVEKTT